MSLQNIDIPIHGQPRYSFPSDKRLYPFHRCSNNKSNTQPYVHLPRFEEISLIARHQGQPCLHWDMDSIQRIQENQKANPVQEEDFLPET